MIGGSIVAVSIAVLVFELAARDRATPEQHVSQNATALLTADAATPDAPQVAASLPHMPDIEPSNAPQVAAGPPRTPNAAAAPATHGATSSAPHAKPSGEVEVECLRYQSDQKWGNLEVCADRLWKTNPTLAKSLKARALLEAKAVPGLRALEAAMQERDLKKAKAELDALPAAVTGYAKLRQRYEEAEASAINDVVARLGRVNSGDCEEYTQIIQQEQASQPPRVAAEAMRLVKCTPTAAPAPDCDHEALANKGNSNYAAGKLATAIEQYEAAWDCKPDPRYAERAFVIACNIPSVTKSKLFWNRMLPAMKQRAIPICIRNGIAEEQLDPP